ncbi:DUF2252 domain-containing protein [Microbacterium sp. NC79]|uniref:DUF2252 domain-containing protein n=1 Tax=Microbacterium sp. NC79 TaxID=2851009 RepID=UPI001C2C26C0|nr:DUF2252 domain-containing protein [Microbacterium sp. NC79]MBV0895878.1 DUF2252 domain-containing protein [Microbacterium sp. NC79]
MTDVWESPESPAEQRGRGIAARTRVRRSDLAQLGTGARDPLSILDAQNKSRDPFLVPLRKERMSASPFAFYRGTAALMAADLADAPHSGILVASCGDAHVSNFGFYASPQRDLVFDLNDFDEAAWAPWEWDLKRLAASIVVGGRATGRTDEVIDEAVRRAVATYVRGIRRAIALSPTERYFTHFDVAATTQLLDKASQKATKASIKAAQKRTGERAVRKLTHLDESGRLRFVLMPPTTTAVDDELRNRVGNLMQQFRDSATPDVSLLFEHYGVSDVVQRVVGVGSVGTRCYLVLLQDGGGHSLLMQPKEAGQSVLIQYGRIEQPAIVTQHITEHGEGARVVAMQRILQALSDPFLGHMRGPLRDFYVRQFHDMKGSIEVEELEDGPFVTYAQSCAAVIARAHSQSATAPVVAGYIGSGRGIAAAILTWARAYADVSLADFEAFRASISATGAADSSPGSDSPGSGTA